MAEWSIEPWGEVRADFRAALIAWTMASIWRGKGQRRPKLEDFLLKFGKEVGVTDPRQIEAIFRSIAQRVEKGKGKKRADDKRKTRRHSDN